MFNNDIKDKSHQVRFISNVNERLINRPIGKRIRKFVKKLNLK